MSCGILAAAAAGGAPSGPGTTGAPPDLGPPNMQQPPVLQPAGKPFPNVSGGYLFLIVDYETGGSERTQKIFLIG